MEKRNPLLGMFAKYWQPGTVKTRLAESVGAATASSLHLLFVGTLLSRLKQLAVTRQLCFTPSDRAAEFNELVRLDTLPWHMAPQVSGDLGQRMESFFRSSLDDGFQPVVLIGSDAPNLPIDYIDRAFELLNEVPVVLGPSDDGGYYLIGLSDVIPPIFDRMEWSTAQVLAQTVERLDQRNVPYALLPGWYDVDEYDDLLRLLRDLDTATEDTLIQLRSEIRKTFEQDRHG